jgi:hypothetical protein
MKKVKNMLIMLEQKIKQKNEETRVSGPDTYKMNDYMIHLINTNKIRIIKASLVD